MESEAPTVECMENKYASPNAEKYTPPQRHVKIRVRRKPATWTVASGNRNF